MFHWWNHIWINATSELCRKSIPSFWTFLNCFHDSPSDCSIQRGMQDSSLCSSLWEIIKWMDRSHEEIVIPASCPYFVESWKRLYARYNQWHLESTSQCNIGKIWLDVIWRTIILCAQIWDLEFEIFLKYSSERGLELECESS